MKKKHLIYSGARYGESLVKLSDLYDLSDQWIIHLFEPNPRASSKRSYQIGKTQ
jgi:hypothetical protein